MRKDLDDLIHRIVEDLDKISKTMQHAIDYHAVNIQEGDSISDVPKNQ